MNVCMRVCVYECVCMCGSWGASPSTLQGYLAEVWASITAAPGALITDSLCEKTLLLCFLVLG